MKGFNIAIVRVVSFNNNSRSKYKHQEIIQDYFPQNKFSTYSIPNQKNGIYDVKTHQESIPKIIELAKEIENNHDGILISCAADPAVLELRNIINVPVSGAGRPAALLSLNIAEDIAVLGMGDMELDPIKDVLGNKITEYHLLNNIENTNELNTAKGKKEVIEAAKLLSNKASVIILACTGMSTIKVANNIRRYLKIPVIDPLISGALFLQAELMSKSIGG